MSTHRAIPLPFLGGWFLLLLFLQSACATRRAPGSPTVGDHHASWIEPGLESATVYEVDFMEPGARALRPVPIPRLEFQRAFQRLARNVRPQQKSPREAAHEFLNLVATKPEESWMVMSGEWEVEQHPHATPTWTPLRQSGPVELIPEAEIILQREYLKWCAHRGGGDCLSLLDDGPSLRADDRRVLALALAFGPVLGETRKALERELLDVRGVLSMVVWTVALYGMLWVVPEPTTKTLAAALTVILLGYLGLHTVYGLMNGWARLADTAHHASTFEELRTAGEEFGAVLGEDAARAMILAVSSLAGSSLGQMAVRVKSLPRFDLAAAQFEAQGGGAIMARLDIAESALASEGALARAVVAMEWVAISPQGPMAVVMLKEGRAREMNRRQEAAPRGPSSATGEATDRWNSATASAGTSHEADRPWTFPPKTRSATCSRSPSPWRPGNGGTTDSHAPSAKPSTMP